VGAPAAAPGTKLYDAREGGPKVLADVLEALIAAAFLDCGGDMEVAESVCASIRTQ
jgi:dsRNA-specific ribonuclease